MNALRERAPRYEVILLLGFGGPERVQDVRAFVERVIAGGQVPVPAERYQSVVNHYIRMGGKSPYNRSTRYQAEALRRHLWKARIGIPVELAYRNTQPFIEDVIERLARQGVRRILGVVMVSHHGSASSERYQRAVAQAQERLGSLAPIVDYASSFSDHPLFIRAHGNRIVEARSKLSTPSQPAMVIFTAHSIPRRLADSDVYERQVRRTAWLIAARLGLETWCVAFQSRSGSPSDPWLGPDVRDVLQGLPKDGFQQAVVSPIGFLCDNFEVIYDLDVDAARVAQGSGVTMVRAKTLNTHHLFIRMLTEQIVRTMSR